MSKADNHQTLARRVLAITIIAVPLGIVHLSNGPEGDIMAYYLLLFAVIYAALASISLWLSFLLNGWRLKTIAVLNAIMATLVVGYDVLGIALGAMQF